MECNTDLTDIDGAASAEIILDQRKQFEMETADFTDDRRKGMLAVRVPQGLPATTPVFGVHLEETVNPTSKPDMGMRSGQGNYRDSPDFTPGFLRPSRGIAGPPLPRCYLDPEKVANVLSRLKNREGGNVEILLVIPAGVNKESLETSKTLTLSTGELELFRKVRSILNKLTPQKFVTLIKQVQGLVIDTETRLKGVTALIWKQATTDTAYAREYASLCTHLQQVEVSLKLKKGKYLRFRIVLLILCRKSFTEILSYAKKMNEEKSTTGNLQETIKYRRKYVGIVRFIGELFQHGMLLQKIILDCLSKLLQSGNDILLECSCHLLLVIGETLEKTDRLDDYFHQIQEILKEKKVSARCCFMLQDVIETRDNEWKPLRQQNTPTTIDAVHRQADLDKTLLTVWDDSYPPVWEPTIIIDPPQTRIPASRHPRPLPDPATVASDLTRLGSCRIYETPSTWSRGTQFLESGEPEEDLYRKVRSILNKLTPQKLQTLIKQVQGLVIDTETRLKGVTDIIFEKAINEPAFSVTYAIMCRYLLTLKVPSDTKQGESVTFRVILLTRCQREFEEAEDIQLDLDRREKEMREAKDQKKVTELKVEFETAVTNAGRRSQGNIRFIAELFKLKMLTEAIMLDCVFKLMKSPQELYLEGACRLFMTIGKKLESEKTTPRLDQYFIQIRRLIADMKLSYRCRFMMFGVIILRKNNWKPRREEDSPKTIDQIHKDAKREADEQNMVTALHMAQLSPTARGRPGGQARGSMEEGWNPVSSKTIRNIDRSIDVSKLRIEKNADNIQLGPARSFGGWGRGNSGGGSRASQEDEKPKAPVNRFSALSKEDDQRSRAFGRGVSPARGEGRMRGNQPGGGFNRGKVIPRSSQEQERERALASARNLESGRTTPPSGSRDSGGASNLEFTVGPDSAPSTPTSKVSLEWITQNLSTLLNDPKCDNEKTFDWIEENIPDDITKESKFIRALTWSVCSSAISGTGNAARVDPEVVKKWRALLIKYLDHFAVFELQALFALQALVNSLRHPSGVLRSFFDTLYDEEIISEDAFNQWETSKEEPEGKGVALKQVVQFFAWLREGEEEADS